MLSKDLIFSNRNGVLVMEWLEKMNRVIDYIEDHLDDDIEYEKLALMTHCSVHHFQRVFSFVADLPLSEYIRRRRMTMAATELQKTDAKIIDLGLKYGYSSPNSFTRAFYSVHQVLPSQVRSQGIRLKAFPRLSFQLSIMGGKEMEYRIIEGESSKVFGKSIHVSFTDGKGYEMIEDFIRESWRTGMRDEIRKAAGYDPEGLGDSRLLGIAMYNHNHTGDYRFMLMADYPSPGVSDDFDVLEIPKAKWAVFTTTCLEDEELDTMTKIWKRLPEWFQSTGFELAQGVPELERCYKTEEGYKAEVWVPLADN